MDDILADAYFKHRNFLEEKKWPHDMPDDPDQGDIYHWVVEHMRAQHNVATNAAMENMCLKQELEKRLLTPGFKYIVRKVEINRGLDEIERHEFDSIIEAAAFRRACKFSEFSLWLFEVEIE